MDIQKSWRDYVRPSPMGLTYREEDVPRELVLPKRSFMMVTADSRLIMQSGVTRPIPTTIYELLLLRDDFNDWFDEYNEGLLQSRVDWAIDQQEIRDRFTRDMERQREMDDQQARFRAVVEEKERLEAERLRMIDRSVWRKKQVRLTKEYSASLTRGARRVKGLTNYARP